MILNITTLVMMVKYYINKYFINFNDIGLKFFTDLIGLTGEPVDHVYEIEISERVDKEVLAEFRAKLTAV